MSFNPFPPAYQFFFCTVEVRSASPLPSFLQADRPPPHQPALTIGGVLFSVFAPLKYHQDLIPTSVASTPSNVHPASLMAVRQLGSCRSSSERVGAATR